MPFTPGPWKSSGCGEVWHPGSKRVICNTQYLDEGETIKAQIAGNWDADADLIAAAPDLYEVVRRALDCGAIGGKHLREAAEKALAKAQGEQS